MFYRKRIEELEGMVSGLGFALGVVMGLHRNYGDEKIVFRWDRVIQERIDRPVEVSFKFTPKQAEGFRKALTKLSKIATTQLPYQNLDPFANLPDDDSPSATA